MQVLPWDIILPCFFNQDEMPHGDSCFSWSWWPCNLTHDFHPLLKAEAIQCSQCDLTTADVDMISLLFGVSAMPLQISTVIGCLKGNDAGRYLPKCIYDMNQKLKNCRTLHLAWSLVVLWCQKDHSKVREVSHLIVHRHYSTNSRTQTCFFI